MIPSVVAAVDIVHRGTEPLDCDLHRIVLLEQSVLVGIHLCLEIVHLCLEFQDQFAQRTAIRSLRRGTRIALHRYEVLAHTIIDAVDDALLTVVRRCLARLWILDRKSVV